MSVAKSLRLSETWKQRFDLTYRGVPELYEDIADAKQCPYADAIRITLRDLGASAVFCVQDVPTVVILVAAEYDQDDVTNLHDALWSQGLASLLLVLAGDVVRVYTLEKKVTDEDQDFEGLCLVRKLDAITEVLAVKDLFYGAESGRLWNEYPKYFDTKERVDEVLLENLKGSYKRLCGDGLSSDAAQALIVQTMFIAYLEDREIVQSDYFETATNGNEMSFEGLLESRRVSHFYRLFELLRKDFNGDLFVAPCSFDLKSLGPRVTGSHMETMAQFRSGRVLMGSGGGQNQFWGYDFKHIPIELVSAVYDRFLGLKPGERRKRGAYYTPMFLANTVIMSVWDTLSEKTRESGIFTDPACGSGIFLVKCFQLLCENWRASHGVMNIRWDSLCKILVRLNGYDINGDAVRVAVFSLYVALLQEVNPPELRRLIKEGKFLPELWGKNLREVDFFHVTLDQLHADVMIGNPPWTSRRDRARTSVYWCKKRNLPMPANEEAWAFVWKSLQHLKSGGLVAFLVPAMGFLHNHGRQAVVARQKLAKEKRIFRIVNFSDLRFQLFHGAVRPAALVVIGNSARDSLGYRFDYWAPKASMNLKARKSIALTSVDKVKITSNIVIENPFALKHRLWMNAAEEKLFKYLSAMRTIGDQVQAFGTLVRKRQPLDDGWVVGEGFQPANVHLLDDERYVPRTSDVIAHSPYLDIDDFQEMVQESGQPSKFTHGLVRSKGFEFGFSGPRILVPRGIATGGNRLRATYTEAPLTFQHIIQAITVPRADVQKGKLLTALLNSKLLLWFAFHGTASLGADRPELQQADLLRLPFPHPNDIQDTERAVNASNALIALVDDSMAKIGKRSLLSSGVSQVPEELDHLSYEYFGLGTEEITLVEDTVKYVIPNVQPHSGSYSDLWTQPNRDDREAYAITLVDTLSSWFKSNIEITALLEAKNEDLALLHLKLDESKSHSYRELQSRAVGEALDKLGAQLNIPLPGNFQLLPDFRLFDRMSLFLVKPLQTRFWLRSTAISDADRLAGDLQQAMHRR